MPAGHWNRHARQWDLIGPPLRPCDEDVAQFERIVREHAGRRPATALLLGVTPEIARMRWPSGSRLLALDHSPGMIHGVWPGSAVIETGVVCGEWLSMPLAAGTFDTVLADGSFALFRFPCEWRRAAERLAEVTSTGARVVLRAFVREGGGESVDDVVDDLAHRRIGNFHIFKWRLAMALQASVEAGVRVADIFDAWSDLGLESAELAHRQGWPAEVVKTIDAYRDAEARYTFPAAENVVQALGSWFRESGRYYPGYELGERCPIMVFDRV